MIAKKPETWRFCGGSYCYVVRRDGGKQEIYLASPDRKKITEAMLKSLTSSASDFIDLWINDEESFSLRLSQTEIGFEVKHPELPDPDTWYLVRNWMSESGSERKYDEIVKILCDISCQHGILEGKFSPIFSDEFPKSVSFTHPGLPTYDEIMEEAERRINVDFGTKTTKWKPGHRYDTEERSFYYVGEGYSRIIDRGKSGGKEKYVFDIKDIAVVESSSPAYLFLTKIPTADIWSNVVTSIGERKKELNYLDYLPKKCSAVDCGEWIDSTSIIPNPMEWRRELMERTLKLCCTTEDEICGIKTLHYHDLNYFFEPLFLYLGKGDEADMKEVGKELNSMIEPLLRQVFLEILGKNYQEYAINDTTEEKKIEDIYSIFLSGYIRDTFYNKKSLYNSLFESLGLNITAIIRDVIQTFNLDTEMKDWEGFIKYNNLIPARDKHIDLRDPKELSRGGYYGSGRPKEKAKLSDIISDNKLRELIINTIKWSLQNYKTGVDMFNLQRGYRKSDTPFYEILITLPNILGYLESEGKTITEEMKKAFISNNFWSTFITAPENIKWEDEV